MKLTFQLPGEDTPLDLKGKIVHARQAGKLAILGIHMLATRVQEKRILKYVVTRKTEILAELEQAFREIHEPFWTPGFY